MNFKTTAEVYFSQHGKPRPEPKGYKTEKGKKEGLAKLKKSLKKLQEEKQA